MKNTILILLIALVLLLGATATLGLLILVKQPIMVIPFTGLLTICGIMSTYSIYLGTKVNVA